MNPMRNKDNSTRSPFEEECHFWNEAYKEAYGIYPNPLVGSGISNTHAVTVQSAVMRYWVEKMREMVSGKEA